MTKDPPGQKTQLTKDPMTKDPKTKDPRYKRPTKTKDPIDKRPNWQKTQFPRKKDPILPAEFRSKLKIRKQKSKIRQKLRKNCAILKDCLFLYGWHQNVGSFVIGSFVNWVFCLWVFCTHSGWVKDHFWFYIYIIHGKFFSFTFEKFTRMCVGKVLNNLKRTTMVSHMQILKSKALQFLEM